ncbi:MAG: DUF1080 domain-containing protein [Planctomycetota bacterium]
MSRLPITLRSSLIFSILSITLSMALSGCQSGSFVRGSIDPAQDSWISLFDGKSLAGWKGLVGNPYSRAEMSPDLLATAQSEADRTMRAHWSVQDGILTFDGKGSHLCTVQDFSDFVLELEWKIESGGDSGIYLRGCPQVQIWDIRQNPVGSGGLYNNQNGISEPLVAADLPPGEWNRFRIVMSDNKVTVHLNGQLVVDSVSLENYWNRSLAVPAAGQIELQSHGSRLQFRNVRIQPTYPVNK